MSADSPTSTPLRILVADDEPMIVRALQRVLEKRGHGVEAVGSAEKGIAALEERDFDALLVDQNMPGSGLALLRAALEGGFGGYAVLMTGGLDAGELDALPGEVVRLQKPFRFAEIVALVEEGCS